jgi:hypothetical protein
MASRAGEKTTVCLTMIVRDEAHIVHEVIEAVAPFIDSWVIVDTGSSDGTQDLIRQLMAERGIPGELHERPWRDFGHNRTEALALAQGHADYIWMMDADDTVTGTIDFSGLSADAYFMRIRDGLTYWRVMLFRDGVPWTYVGVVHEVAHCDMPHTKERLEGDYQVHSRRLGARSKDPRKYARDAEVLQAVVDANPEDVRSTFYLAQSYLHASDFANARRWYERRAQMGGWDEEVFQSLFRGAEAMERLGEPWPLVQQAYLAAWSFRPTRAEPLHAIARWYRVNGQYVLGHHFAQAAAQISLPVDDALFVIESVYAWQALDEQAVCASWIGKSPESFAICRQLISQPALPEVDRQRIAANRDLAVSTMLDLAAVQPAEAMVQSLGGPQADVMVTLIAGADLASVELSINTFITCCLDRKRISRFVVVCAQLSADDQTQLVQRYPFVECVDAPSVGDSRYWLYLSQGYRFFSPEAYIARMVSVLDAEPDIAQVGVNFEDSSTLSGRCAPEESVRRTALGQRYVMANIEITGPVLIDTIRFDGRATSAATLDEVLCVAAE